MALNMFLTLDGINGGSVDPAHKGAIEITSWSWGLSEVGSPTGGGGGAGAGKVAVQNIVITKVTDSTSPLLLQHCATGAIIASGTVATDKAGAPASGEDFLLIKMTDVLVKSVAMSSSTSNEAPAETVTLAFTKVEFDSRPQTASGGLGPPVVFRWDLATGAPA
jgi:type VI secretion system secreted protein Hcp